jgi:hypothetical protein
MCGRGDAVAWWSSDAVKRRSGSSAEEWCRGVM